MCNEKANDEDDDCGSSGCDLQLSQLAMIVFYECLLLRGVSFIVIALKLVLFYPITSLCHSTKYDFARSTIKYYG